MIFQILGPLQVAERVLTTSPVRRALLTAFLLRTGQSIGIGELAQLLWDDPPCSAAANIRSHLTGLRRDLDRASRGLSGRLETYRGSQTSYSLRVAAQECDLSTFTLTARRGRELLVGGQPEPAMADLERAVAMWRGPFGQDLPATRWFGAHVAGLNDARINAYQDLFTACVLANRTEMLSYRIEAVLAEAPYRQRLWELLATVHTINGDAAGALAVIRRCQDLFADDLGLDLPPNLEAMRGAALSWNRGQALELLLAAATGDATGGGRNGSPALL
ncbi:BTAD domain-containing putative transcriptional regulator [Plantactinospora siamensis]|uniref:BTAD domain-containing putative transcriptional regulator n=1 Tax=Plantactinospora siamensis TaxID=555372 RepID=A0ABV6NTZ5_9ACTN